MSEKSGIGYLVTSTWTAPRRSWHACHYFTLYTLGIKDECGLLGREDGLYGPISGPA